ncbi:hypothetical protein NCCP2716_00050 [Sporosarcina sp. NCCP-2716]|nr:hypothetical protein NCCP2716_00050 [Sporosarcina sp. NCCP-2716]
MRQDYTHVQNIYIVCGKTDMRKGIDGLVDAADVLVFFRVVVGAPTGRAILYSVLTVKPTD